MTLGETIMEGGKIAINAGGDTIMLIAFNTVHEPIR